MDQDLEGVARSVLERAGFDDVPVDAFDLAAELGLPVKWVPGAHGYRIGPRLFVPTNARLARIHGVLAHEIAHVLLDQHGISQSERAACYLGAALLVPRRLLARQLRAGWDLHGLMALHANASAELLGRRIVDVQDASFAVYDAGRLRYRIGRHDERERSLVERALSTGEPERLDDLHGAWPIIDGRWRRVIVLAPSD